MSEKTDKVEQKPDLGETLKKLDMTATQLEGLVTAGVVMPKPDKLEDLPDPVRKQVSSMIRDEITKSEEVLKSQLYGTIEKQKKDLEKLLNAEQTREQERLWKEKQAEQERLAELEKTKTLEQKLQEQKEEASKLFSDVTSKYESEFAKLRKSMESEKLAVLREKLIIENGVGDLDVFIPDPLQTDVTEEGIKQAVELAKAKLESLKMKSETIKQTTEGAQIPTGDSHISGNRAMYETNTIRSASKEDLNKIKEDVYKKYSQLFS